MLAEVYPRIKAVDPEAQIVMGGEDLGLFYDFPGGRVQEDAVGKCAASIDTEMQGRGHIRGLFLLGSDCRTQHREITVQYLLEHPNVG